MNRRILIVGMVAALGLLQGCIGADGKFTKSFSSPLIEAAAPAVLRMDTMWQNGVVVTEDVVNQGAQLPGIAGRVYFFGTKSGIPVTAKGTLIVIAHEVLPDNKTAPLDSWEIDPATLARLGSSDIIGWGYTVFLPFSKYRPEVKRVQMQVKFVQEKGAPLFSSPTAVSLWDEAPPVITSNVLTPGGAPTSERVRGTGQSAKLP